MKKNTSKHQFRYQLNAIRKKIATVENTPELLLKLQQRFIRLVRQYQRLLSDKSFRKSVMSLSVILGLSITQKAQSQNVQSVKKSGVEIGLNKMSGFYLPTFIDLDADGDLDLHGITYDEILGEYEVNQMSFENVGTPETPLFGSIAQDLDIPIAQEQEVQTIKAVDIDSDGDMDVIAMVSYYGFFFIENSGTVQNPQFEEASDQVFGLERLMEEDLGLFFDFGDIDADGDLDILIQQWNESTGNYINRVIENRGTPQNASFDVDQSFLEFDTDNDNEYTDSNSWIDIDSDGDLDILQSKYSYSSDTENESFVSFFWIENVGSPQNLELGDKRLLPGTLSMEEGYIAHCIIADLDADGDEDILVMNALETGDDNYETEFIFLENETPVTNDDVVSELISVFPNPSSEYIHISGMDEIRMLRLIDASGKMVLQEKNAAFLDVSAVAKGIYFIEITDSQGRKEVQKIQVSRE